MSPFYRLEVKAVTTVIRLGRCSWPCRPFTSGLEVRTACRGSREKCRFDAGGRWWAALVVGLHRLSRGEWEHGGTGWLGLSCLRRFELVAPGTLAGVGLSLAVVVGLLLTTPLSDTLDHLRGTSCTRGPTDVLSIQSSQNKEGVEPHPPSVHDSTR